jgi:maleate isomerase
MRHVNPEELRAMNAEIDRAATELADLRPDVVVSGCLVAIMAEGPGHHSVVERQLAASLQAEGSHAPTVTSAGALLAALTALGAGRVAMITPYAKPLTRLVADYIEAAGIEVHDALSLEVTDNRAVAALAPRDLEQHWRRLDIRGCDALVVSACVQMPSLAAIESVELACGLPTLSATSATAWSILRAMNLKTTVPGAGVLLAGATRTATA